MSRPALELADIFRQHGALYRALHALPLPALRVMRAIETCRTAVLGGHVEECSQCGFTRISYNSCRNRHCPKCQNAERRRWLQRRKAELLPVPYFHVVFTLPELIAAIALQNKALVYGLLFRTVAATLLTIARDPQHLGAQIGFFAVLHTWGQNLLHHPHLHCVIPGGGLSPDGKRWVACRPGFFLPVRVLSRLFRRLFLEALEQAHADDQLRFYGDLQYLRQAAAFTAYLEPTRQTEWVVYAKPPFGGPQQVLEYLGRYTHRVALSNDRLRSLREGQVTFQWKDYRHPQRPKLLCLAVAEFIRRFLLHVLPPGFQRIRHFGFLANRQRQTKLALCRQLLRAPVTELLPTTAACQQLSTELFPDTPPRCPQCGGELIRTHTLPAYRWPAQPPDTS
jgi:predicted Zn-ribbon and HTH transcriptional regulator